jgi:hypothetical protein
MKEQEKTLPKKSEKKKPQTQSKLFRDLMNFKNQKNLAKSPGAFQSSFN